MPVTAIVGAQWGDEGKGKITDLLAQQVDMVVRFGGGGNAGHTVVNEHGEFRLHTVPSGIFNQNALSLVGTGCVVDFDYLAEELCQLDNAGIQYTGLRISNRAHVIMPYHLRLDRLEDQARGEHTIGTTRRGVGPAYTDKAARVGIQVGDILDPVVLRRKLDIVLPAKNERLEREFNEPPVDAESILVSAQDWRQRFGWAVVDQVSLVADTLESGKSVLLEGQLGALRDLDWGTYPYVTSSTTIAGGGAVGGGFPAMRVDEVLGVVKAYTTAVGTGPLPTELSGDMGTQLRELGDEYGATTGRPRRTGWFDAVATRYACRLNGFTGIAVMKLDVLDTLSEIQVCTAYQLDGECLTTVPLTSSLERVQPRYEPFPGWQTSTAEARSWKDLPQNARRYVEWIGELTGAPVKYVSVGPGREQTITL